MDKQLKKCQFIRHLDAETSNVESFTVDGEPRIIRLDGKESFKPVVAEYATGVKKSFTTEEVCAKFAQTTKHRTLTKLLTRCIFIKR